FIAEYYEFLLIPFISSGVGYLTNWLAIKMTFYPIEYRGIRPFGWQGIIPSKARKMAEKSVDLLTVKLVRVEEQFERLDPERIAEEMQPSLDRLSRQLLDEVMEARASQLWKNTPNLIKERFYKRTNDELPSVIIQMMAEMSEQIEDLLDLKAMSVKELMKDKTLVNQIFQRCGYKEFLFIEKSGFYLGFPFGVIQMVVTYFFFDYSWFLLPFFGLLVGWATNAIALKVIFRPRKPINLLGLKIHGLFLKRQSEVAAEYSKMITNHILTTENIFEFVVRGPGAARLNEIIEKHVHHVVNTTVGLSKNLLKTNFVNDQMEIIRNIVAYRFQQELPVVIVDIYRYAERALKMQETLETKMAGLPSDEFEAFLRPAFQEDEWILITVGAVLGLLAGVAQYFIFF
ncbi:MAG: hypothetical protein AAF740_13275, partial [Bacteroidota bacterium]